ncbi:damage-inducible type I toxin DinQ [Serratia nevei]|uniref:damage-inducible type I toxin DinQ n=1 Tax=Serratia nevei TaxID=2703794 RepID=UPI003F7673CF
MNISSPGRITGGAGFGALTGVRQHSANKPRASRCYRQCKSKQRWLTPVWEKRVKTLIDKVIIVLKALVALLELIRQFID